MNAKRYFTGMPCVNGHTTERFVSSRGCVECARLRGVVGRKSRRAKDREELRRWRAANPSRVSLHNNRSRRRWQQMYPDKSAAKSALRRMVVARATPPWVDQQAVEAFYDACPAGYHVDHIIPLHGKTVSGLHVHNNLQYLLPVENSKKGNRHAE